MKKVVDTVCCGTLALSVLCGPGIWLVALSAVYTGRLVESSNEVTLFYLCLSFVLSSWALWGIVSGPKCLPRWLFGAASVLNILAGVHFLNYGYGPFLLVSMLFLAYSLWQFFVARRPVVYWGGW